MTGKIFSPLLLLLAKLTESELLHTIQFLKAENGMLRSRLPRSLRTTPAERSRLLKLAEPLGNAVKELISIVTFRTFQRWRADAKKTTRRPGKRKHGRPRKPEEIRELVCRLARENGWGYTRILGELKKLRIRNICRNTVKNILKENGFDLGPKRGYGTWPKVWHRRFGRRSRARDEFLKIHLKTLWACDIISKEVWTLHGKVTYFILFFIEIGTRRVKILGQTAHPNGEWVTQMARNMRMWWEEHGIRPSYIMKDRDTRFTSRFDGILESIGAKVKPISVGSPNLNPYAEAWVSTFKRECLDKFIVYGETHLDHICSVYESYYNVVRPHGSLDNAPIGLGEMPAPESTEEKDGVVCETWLGGLLRGYRRAA